MFAPLPVSFGPCWRQPAQRPLQHHAVHRTSDRAGRPQSKQLAVSSPGDAGSISLADKENSLQEQANPLSRQRQREEAVERAVLQQQLLAANRWAEGNAAELEAVRSQRAALQAQSELQGVNLAMLERRLGYLRGEVQALETQNLAAATAWTTLVAERDQLSAQLQAFKQEMSVALSHTAEQQDAAREALTTLEEALEDSRRLERQAVQQQVLMAQELSAARLDMVTTQQQAEAALQEVALLRQRLEEPLAAAQVQAEPETQAAVAAPSQQTEELLASQRQAQASMLSLSSELQQAQDTIRALTQQIADVEAQLALTGTGAGAAAGSGTQKAQREEAGAEEQRQWARRLQAMEMQLESSQRERQLEVAMVVNNFLLAREQGAAATAAVELLRAEVDALRAANQQQQQQLEVMVQPAQAEEAVALQQRVGEVEAQLAEVQAKVETLDQEKQQALATNASLSKEVQVLKRRLSVSERVQAQRAAATQLLATTRPLQGASSLPQGAHVNINRYWSPPGLHFPLMKALALREASLQAYPDFLGMRVEPSEQQVIVTSVWQSRPAFESWASDRAAAASLPSLPSGVMQYPQQDKGEGVPEPYMPIRHT